MSSGSRMTVFPRARRTVPRFSSARRTRLAVARDVAASPAMSSCVSGMRVPGADWPEHARLSRYEERLEQAVARAPDARCEQANEHLVHLWVLAAHSVEVVSIDRERLASFDGCDSRRAQCTHVHEGKLAARLAGTVDRDRHRVSELRGHPGCEVS